MFWFFVSLQNWTNNQLNRTLFDVPTVPSVGTNEFPQHEYEPIEKLSHKVVVWMSMEAMNVYFSARMANKGKEKGRRLFMCDFVKNTRFYQNVDNVFFTAICCAEMKKKCRIQRERAHQCS